MGLAENHNEQKNNDYELKRVEGVPPTLCAIPWNHRFTNIGGEIQLCCVSEEFGNTVLGDDGRPLNMDHLQDDEFILNTRWMKDVRREMLAGRWPKYCERCRQTEKGGGVSSRQLVNAAYSRSLPNLIKNTQIDGTINAKVESVDLRLGNQCNLACRMCSPRSSSRWARDWMKVDHGNGVGADPITPLHRGSRYFETQGFWENFKKQAPHLKDLHFAGGEPMIVPQMIKALKVCIDSGSAKNMCLTYNSNIVTIPDEAKELWRYFGDVRIFASLDAFGPLNDYIRHPSRWADISQSLEDLEANFDQYHLSQVLVKSTVQIYNVTQIGDLFDYLLEGFKRVIPVPHLTNLYHPLYYRTQVLPRELKAAAREQLSQLKERTKRKLSGHSGNHRAHLNLNSLDDIIHFMESEDHQALLPTFLRVALSKDRYREENLFKVLPEFEVLRRYAPQPNPVDIAT